MFPEDIDTTETNTESDRGFIRQREESLRCPNCQQAGQVYYTGKRNAAETPVQPDTPENTTYYYECEQCGHTWHRTV